MSEPVKHHQIPDVVQPNQVSELDIDSVEKDQLIGTGGDAKVYAATANMDEKTTELAIKEPRIQNTMHNDVRKKFEREAETWSSLSDHKNIVTVYDWGANPLPWLGLEYMDGGTLEKKIGSMSLPEALWLSGRIADGIYFGHRHGVAHLDIKPANILLRSTSEGHWDYPKISDWGLSKMLLESSNSTKGISPTYGAPEQFETDEFGDPDDITDIYQLGSLVYAMTTDEPPFSGSSREIMQGVLAKDPDPPSEENSSVPRELDEVILKALSKSKSDRYDGLLLFKKELDRLFRELTTDDRDNRNSSSGTENSQERRKELIESEEIGASNTSNREYNRNKFDIKKPLTLSKYIKEIRNYNGINFQGLNESISKISSNKQLSEKIKINTTID